MTAAYPRHDNVIRPVFPQVTRTMSHDLSPAADHSYSTERRSGERRGAARLSPDAERRGGVRPLSATSIGLVALVLTCGAWVAGRFNLYTPGSDLGYYMGLVGSTLMALLLLYPLRKRAHFLQRTGELRHWFKLHMFLGIAGPVLVIYHSTLRVGSLNAAVAFYSMLVVAGSGIIGRFIYTKIHHGLYGRQATLRERQEHLGLAGESLKSKFHFAPRTEERLRALEAYAADERGFLGVGRLVAVTVRVRWVYWKSMREVRHILARAAVQRGWEPLEQVRRIRLARRVLKGYHSSAGIPQSNRPSGTGRQHEQPRSWLAA